MQREITGSEALVEALRLEGVEIMFGLVGSAFMDPLDIFPKADIRFIQVRHEQSAALMADGYARASGKPGVCVGQNGPGVTNMATGISSAFLNHTPVVFLTPTVTSSSQGSRSFQEIDQISMFRPIVNHQVQVNRPDRMGEAVRTAFRAAIATRGPAQIDIPRDYYYGTFKETEMTPDQYRLDGRYGGAPAEQIEKAAKLLLAAERPVILAGLGSVDSEAGEAIGKLADRLGAPVACVWLHNDAFPANHPMHVGPIGYQGSKAAMRLLKEADVLLALGTRLNRFGTVPQYDIEYFPKSAKLIQNSINPLEIGAMWPIAAGLLGDCRAVTEQLLAATEGKTPKADVKARRAKVAEEKKAWAKDLEEMSKNDQAPMIPRRALWEIAKATPENAAVVCDVGNISGTASGYFNFNEHRRWFGHGSLGGIGVGYATALGVKLGRPDLPVLTLGGDGAWGMTMQEVMTAVQEKINVVAIILNNSQYGAEKRNQYDFFNERFFWTDLENPDFSKIAGEMGALTMRVEKFQDIGPKLKEAFAAERPVVMEVMTDPKVLVEPYRRDALEFPKRLLPRYRN